LFFYYFKGVGYGGVVSWVAVPSLSGHSSVLYVLKSPFYSFTNQMFFYLKSNAFLSNVFYLKCLTDKSKFMAISGSFHCFSLFFGFCQFFLWDKYQGWTTGEKVESDF